MKFFHFTPPFKGTLIAVIIVNLGINVKVDDSARKSYHFIGRFDFYPLKMEFFNSLLFPTQASIFFFVLLVFFAVLWFLLKKSRGLFRFLKSLFVSMKDATAQNPDVRRFVEKHPSLFKFLGRRLDKSRFFGLPLTLLAITFLYVVFLFLGVIQDVFSSNPIVTADVSVANLFFAFRNAGLIAIFTWITLLAKWQIIVSSTAVVVALLWLWKKRTYIMPLLVTMAGAESFNVLGKLFFHRLRPATAYYIEDSFSFPSGHATMAAAFYGFIAYVLFREIRKWKYRTTILFFGIATILAIGLSRLYLGEHFLSDVWGGYQLGLSWLIIGISLTEWLIRKKIDVSRSPLSRKVKFVSALLISAELVFYAVFAVQYRPPLSTPEEAKSEKIVVSDVLNIFEDKKISRFAETPVGNNQEPISFIIVAKDDEALAESAQKAGWYVADSVTFSSIVQFVKTAILNKDYPTAPMTPSFWDTKINDFGFEKPTDANSARARHHARFWRTQFKTPNGGNIYVGIASLDSGIKWGITHKIEPDIDTEREFFFADLNRAGVIAGSEKVQFVKSLLGKNFSGDQFFTDGKLYEIYLK